MLKDSRLDVGR